MDAGLGRLRLRLAGQDEALALLCRAEAAQADLQRLFDDVRGDAAPVSLERYACARVVPPLRPAGGGTALAVHLPHRLRHRAAQAGRGGRPAVSAVRAGGQWARCRWRGRHAASILTPNSSHGARPEAGVRDSVAFVIALLRRPAILPYTDEGPRPRRRAPAAWADRVSPHRRAGTKAHRERLPRRPSGRRSFPSGVFDG